MFYKPPEPQFTSLVQGPVDIQVCESQGPLAQGIKPSITLHCPVSFVLLLLIILARFFQQQETTELELAKGIC
jgi:hypothetical protein